MAAINLADPLRNVIEEVSVMRHGKHGALVTFQELLEPEHGFCVKVVCRLIEQQ